MPGSGVARMLMAQKGANNSSLKGDYNARVRKIASKNVHNQKKSKGKK